METNSNTARTLPSYCGKGRRVVHKFMRCIRCKRKPHQVPEFIEAAKGKKIPPELFVEQFETTFTPDDRKFYCPQCAKIEGAA